MTGPGILLVDDDEVSNFLTAEIISKSHISAWTHAVRNGEQALRYLRENLENGKQAADLIFLDLNMPVMDGFQFLEAFQKMPDRIRLRMKVIILTSSSSQSDMMRANEYPIVAYINKPLTPEKLKPILDFD